MTNTNTAKKITPRLSTLRKMELYSSYLSDLMRLKAPTILRVSGFENDNLRIIKVEIAKRRNEKSDSIWDQVTVDGEHCGNRCGGAQKLAELFAPYFG